MNRLCYVNGAGGLPTTETRFGERLFAVNLVKTMEVGTTVTSEAAMVLVYGRKSGKSGLVFFRTRPFPLGMEGGSTFGKMFGAARRCCVLFIPPFLIWLRIKRPRSWTCGIAAGGKGAGLRPS